MKRELGGTLLGFIIGVVVGLGAALAVAVYVTKVPIPFMNKGQSRSAEQDEAEAKKNKDWDPNAPLYGKNPAKTSTAPAVAPTPSASAPTAKPVPTKNDLDAFTIEISDFGVMASEERFGVLSVPAVSSPACAR